jgi:asparagine synthase (glutamine-hydrolysing)
MGFGIPIAAWFRDELKELVRETLLSENAKSNQFFQTEKVAALCQAHWNKEQNHGYRLWNLLILEMWLRKWTQ